MASCHQVVTKAIPIMMTPKLRRQLIASELLNDLPKDDEAEPVPSTYFAQDDVGGQLLDIVSHAPSLDGQSQQDAKTRQKDERTKIMYGGKKTSEMMEYRSPTLSASDCSMPCTRATEMLVRSLVGQRGGVRQTSEY